MESTVEEVQKAPPKLFEHCCRVFNSMRAEAVPLQIDGTEGTKRHALVYQGHTTKLFRMLNMPAPYYTSVLTKLQQMGCVVQLSRGGGSAESRWELLDDPTLENFTSVSTSKGPSRLSAVEKDTAELRDRLAAVEEQLSQGA